MTVYEMIQKLSQFKPDAKVIIYLDTNDSLNEKEIESIQTISWHGKNVEIILKGEDE